MMVRAAVLKMKDPKQIIRDMEKLDEMGGYESVSGRIKWHECYKWRKSRDQNGFVESRDYKAIVTREYADNKKQKSLVMF